MKDDKILKRYLQYYCFINTIHLFGYSTLIYKRYIFRLHFFEQFWQEKKLTLELATEEISQKIKSI